MPIVLSYDKFLENPKKVIDDYVENMKKGTGNNLDDLYKPVLDLFREQGPAMVKLLCAKLNSRPKTLVHGDWHCGNMFKHKTKERTFALIDW